MSILFIHNLGRWLLDMKTMKRVKGNIEAKVCHIVIGEWQVARERCMEIARKYLSDKNNGETNVIDGTEVSARQILELLRTKGLFASSRAVVVKDAVGLLTQEDVDMLAEWVDSKKDEELNTILILHFTSNKADNGILSPILKRSSFTDVQLEINKGGDLKKYVLGLAREAGKTMNRGALDLFVELVGNVSISAVRAEMEKLISSIGEKKQITELDVEELVFRHREEEIYRIGDAVRKRDLSSALRSMAFILDQGIPAIAVASAIRNCFVRMLAIKSAASLVNDVNPPRNFNEFKRSYWPRLMEMAKECGLDHFVKMPPYGAFLHLNASYEIQELMSVLEEFAFLDLDLKGSKVEPRILMENFLMNIIG